GGAVWTLPSRRIQYRTMSRTNPKVAVFPGMFDPLTHGHLDIIRRGARLYERLVVAVGHNPVKQEVFSPEERRQMLIEHTSDLTNVEVETYGDLTVEFAREVGAGVILRGIRDTVDLHAELEIAMTNLIIGDVETVFLMTSGQHVLTSSTLIKQIVEIGRYDTTHLSRLVPLDVAKRLEERLRCRRGQ
ncbi:MAG: pantetheine-phosphate adenylyltransferase, partial [Planctomycetes bacterium]|nr:pantetheine-phosphate adenylyltransferase [Planctomycetota bacterium]